MKVRCPPCSSSLWPPEWSWELHCFCCWKTYVTIYPGWTRDAQKVSVYLQLWFQAGTSDCVLLGWVGVACASGKCGPGSGLAVSVMGCVWPGTYTCVCLAKCLSGLGCCVREMEGVCLALCASVCIRQCVALCVYFGFLSLFGLRKLRGGKAGDIKPSFRRLEDVPMLLEGGAGPRVKDQGTQRG